jgi:hypothetical protein
VLASPAEKLKQGLGLLASEGERLGAPRITNRYDASPDVERLLPGESEIHS